jgi:hypothetical protein
MEWPHRCGLDDVAAANVLVNADALFGWAVIQHPGILASLIN